MRRSNKNYMGKNKPKNDGSMPSVVVNQLFEHSPGGFILFYFNQENGAPEQVMSFDSPAHCLALQKYIQDWDEALHQVTLDQSVQTIQDNIQKMNGEEPEE